MASMTSKVPRAFARRPVALFNSCGTVTFTRFSLKRPILSRASPVQHQIRSVGGNSHCQLVPDKKNELCLDERGGKYTKYAAGALFFLVVFWVSNKIKYRVPESEYAEDFDIPHTEETPRLSDLICLDTTPDHW
ncbi:hypothetical protein FPOAC2_11466 [Fusarium poae]|uniref:Uncharacterized protein n=1 Tax=Fusarium poae TaxID=36050 RepID=A0A1B8ADS3_FUSPO|nr:hypothetical protein FPOAC1_011161 [Fusarium poae]KAG8666356.1 hypothetical protein FPOAC1_011161 [Fusarium poae]OBS18621.1 hypothetical protein FPOA_10348 [Fusarium poae]